MLILGPVDSLESLSQIPVVPLSTQERGLPWEVVFDESDGLPRRCVLKPEWIRSVDRGDIGPWIASIPENRWPMIRSGVLRALGFEG